MAVDSIVSASPDPEGDILFLPLEQDAPSQYDSGTRAEIAEGLFRHEASDFSITIRQLHAIHGTWDDADTETDDGESEADTESSPTSLLVFRLELHSRSPKLNRRFRHVRVKLRFERESRLTPADDPYVRCYEPAQGTSITLLPTEVVRSREAWGEGEVGLGGAAMGAPVQAVLRYGTHSSATWQQRERVRISGTSKKSPAPPGFPTTPRRLGDNVVEWSIHENPQERDIPDSYGLAVLLNRSDATSRFRAVFEVKATVDYWYKIATLVDTFHGRRSGSKIYDPKIQARKQPEGVTAERLGLLAKGTALAGLSFSHLPENVEPVRVYLKGRGRR